jgi:hypothetical protein
MNDDDGMKVLSWLSLSAQLKINLVPEREGERMPSDHREVCFLDRGGWVFLPRSERITYKRRETNLCRSPNYAFRLAQTRLLDDRHSHTRRGTAMSSLSSCSGLRHLSYCVGKAIHPKQQAMVAAWTKRLQRVSG